MELGLAGPLRHKGPGTPEGRGVHSVETPHPRSPEMFLPTLDSACLTATLSRARRPLDPGTCTVKAVCWMWYRALPQPVTAQSATWEHGVYTQLRPLPCSRGRCTSHLCLLPSTGPVSTSALWTGGPILPVHPAPLGLSDPCGWRRRPEPRTSAQTKLIVRPWVPFLPSGPGGQGPWGKKGLGHSPGVQCSSAWAQVRGEEGGQGRGSTGGREQRGRRGGWGTHGHTHTQPDTHIAMEM